MHITPEMLNELTDEQKERLREWWKPQPGDMIPCEDGTFPLTRVEPLENGYMCYFVRKPEKNEFTAVEFNFGSRCGILPLLNIGQCIAFLREKCKEISIGYNDSGCFWHVHIGPRGTGNMLEGFGEQHAEPDTGELIIPLWTAVKAVL